MLLFIMLARQRSVNDPKQQNVRMRRSSFDLEVKQSRGSMLILSLK